MDIIPHFAPYQSIATALAPHALEPTGDAAHDASHLLRVWQNVQTISRTEGGDGAILAAATLLHDCVSVPKDSPQRAQASLLASNAARKLLPTLGWSQDRIDQTCHAIEAHSFSAGITPRTTEARILQDADRLDAIGHIGIARCFYVSGRLGRALYDPDDPPGENRALDDMAYALDHFQTKLLKLQGSFQTETGNHLARTRHTAIVDFLNGFLSELPAP